MTAPEIAEITPAHTALSTDVFIATLLSPAPILGKPHPSSSVAALSTRD
jgi:hypothetical protein